jgi:peptide subunit release factor RF-3
MKRFYAGICEDSDPDAGKTTFTEKLPPFGGAIQLTGEVKARGDRRRARTGWLSDASAPSWSSSAVMSFEHEGLAFNLLDTPWPPGFQCVWRMQSAPFISVSYRTRRNLLARRHRF